MFILGSGSARRKALLAQIGVKADDVRPPDIDETPRVGELPRAYCSRMAVEKVMAVKAQPDDIVLCADTTVALGRRILGKPEDEDEARAFLRAMSGRRHRVITAVAVRRKDRLLQKDVVSTVRFKALSDHEVESYVATDDWRGKAGGYAIQGPAAAFVPWMRGSYSAIVGLPLVETVGLLRAAGLKVLQ